MATHRLIDRETARLSELKHFFTGEPCVHGHVALRYTSNGICVKCHDILRRECLDRRRAERDIAIAQRQTAKAEQALDMDRETGALLEQLVGRIWAVPFQQFGSNLVVLRARRRCRGLRASSA